MTMHNNELAVNKQQDLMKSLGSPAVYDRLKTLLNDAKIAGRMRTNMLSIVGNNQLLQKCDSTSILSAVGQAAAMNLSISPALGQAYIVPYKDKNGYKAQFQVGAKGIYQLALRSGQYKTINVDAVHEGEIQSRDRTTGEITWQDKTSDKIVGYFAAFELHNGFRKTVYMSVEELKTHAKKYSQSYRYDVTNNSKTSPWTTLFDAMAQKTVLKSLISKYGIISIELETAMQADQAVIVEGGKYRYIDNEKPIRNVETVETLPVGESIVEEIPLEDSVTVKGGVMNG